MATILVIDDDPDALLLVSFALEKAGHRVVTSSDPHQIGQLVESLAADAVVLDVLMPGLSGHEALRVLRDRPRTGGVPVLLLSARAEGQDRVFGLRQGADDFLSKPFEPEELILRIERLIATRHRPLGLGGSNLERSLQEGKVVGPLFLGRYQALEVIGEGGSGLVFRGWDPWLKRPVALKTLRFESGGRQATGGTVADLLHEAVTVARFSHPNIVTVYDAASDSEVAFIAMEYVDGPSLAHYLEHHGKLTPGQVVQLGIPIARGLAAAHAHGIVHHDVKPGNILLGRDGSVKVSDFGVARLITSLAEDHQQIFGTPGYMPPELLLGQPYQKSGDLFGLGVLFFQCLTGQMPFSADQAHPDRVRRILLNTLHSYVPTPRDLEPGTPLELDELVRELLVKDPDKRLADAAQVAERLYELQESPWRPDPEELRSVKTRGKHEVPMSMTVSRSELVQH